MMDSGALPGPRTRVALVLCLGLLSAACRTASALPPMPLEKAGSVATLAPSVPPPRTIDDIVAALYEQRRTEPSPTDLPEADATPPDTSDRSTLVRFYFRRSLATWGSGRLTQVVDDLVKATEYADGETSPALHVVWNELANFERKRGDFARTTEYLLKALATVPDRNRGWKVTLHSKLVMVYAATGHLTAAETALAEASRIFAASPAVTGLVAATRANLLVARAALAEATGEDAAAELGYREAIAVQLTGPYARHPVLDEFHYFLVRTLIGQGRLLEAGSEARRMVLGAVTRQPQALMTSPRTKWSRMTLGALPSSK